MIVSILALLVGFSPQAQPAVAGKTYVVSVVNERAGDDVSIRFVLSGPPSSYSARKDGDDILVKIAAEGLPGLSLPAATGPVRALSFEKTPGFTVRVSLSESRPYEMLRESASLRLVLRKRPATAAPPPVATPSPDALALPEASPTPPEAPVAEASASDTADLYRRLFPSTTDASAIAPGGETAAAGGSTENWYSDTRVFGVQVRPWVSVSYVDAKTTEVQVNTVTKDQYWVVQPNLGVGFSTHLGGEREGQWRVNYTPRFRKQLDFTLPHLASHFVDVSLDHTLSSSFAFYGVYHFGQGTLETDEIDPGREYGIGLNRLVDTSLERFKRNSLDLGIRFEFLGDTKADISVGKTKVLYGNDPGEETGERAFFDYDTRTLNASLRRGLGGSRLLGLVFTVHDAPTQPERKQVEGRGYSIGGSLEGQIMYLTTGRILLGYRTQKNPNAGIGGQEYGDFAYGLELAREVSDHTNVGFSADRKLYLSNYEENGFYVADTLRPNLTLRLPLDIFFRGSAYFQANNYETSPQVSETTGRLTLRKDKLRGFTLGLTRNLTSWAFLRFDYLDERRDSNLDRFDINTRTFTFQLGLGFFGKSGRQGAPGW